MAKLYIFGIGGTGSRVLRSLTMLMASGVSIDINEIVPIIIDPDVANADLTRTVSLMNKYHTLRSKLHFGDENPNQFFKVDLNKIFPNYLLNIKNTDSISFQQFIDYASMSKENQALTKMLFSEKNLQSSMEVGFKGNPNIGSVVLNQIVDSDEFEKFANSFQSGDKIFIISSIFGGTGASGFPLLLKTLRIGKSFPNFNLINQANIGALTVLPYFKLNPSDESEIDSSTFISKTKSALAYYEEDIIKSGSINSLYYLADDISNTYNNCEGGASQANDAHLIEFLGATAIIDFANSPQSETTNKELGIKDISGDVSFDSFYSNMRGMLYNPLVQFTMMANALLDKPDYFTSSTFAANRFFNDFYDKAFYSELKGFCQKHREWLIEMKRNKRSLDLFNTNCGNKPFELITGVKPRKIISHLSDYDLVADRLNSAVRNCKSKDKEDLFLEMFYTGTKKLIKEKL